MTDITFKEIKEILNKVNPHIANMNAKKILKLNLPNGLRYIIKNIFEMSGEDFTTVWNSMSIENKPAILYQAGINSKLGTATVIFDMWMKFINDYKNEFYVNPFANKQVGPYLNYVATGNANAESITPLQFITMYSKIDENGKLFLINCCFKRPVKQDETATDK